MSTPTPTSRRRFIALVGGGAVLATAPLAGCSSGVPAAAVEAWTAAPPADADPRRFMLAHALLAPNPHNRQPWLADLRRPGEITLVCDGERLLPETDPFGRQILIGCGAFVELAVIAAAERGFRVDVQPFPDGEPGARELPGGRAVARLVLKADAGVPRDPLFAQIRRRHTHKGAYENRPLDAAAWSALAARAGERGVEVGGVADGAAVTRLRAIAREAWRIEMTTPRTYLESAHLLRIGGSEIARHRDGISVTGAMPALLSAVGLFDRFEVPREGSSNLERVMERYTPTESGAGFLWIATRGPARRAAFDAGRAYVRAHLEATARGLAMHPLSQALQEFPEMAGPYAAVHRALGFDPAQATVQMLARVGHPAAPAAPSPRRPLDGFVSRA